MGNNKKKILFVDHDFNISGSIVSMSYLIKEFVKNNYTVIVLTKGDEPEIKYLKSFGAQIIKYSRSPFKSITLSLHISDKTMAFSKSWFKNLFKDIIYFFNGILLSVKVIRKVKPDLIYLNEYVTIPFGFYPKLKAIPVFVHIRSLFIDQKFNLRIFLLKKALKFIPDYCFAITEIEAKQVSDKLNKKSNIRIIPEFLGPDDFNIPGNVTEIKNSLKIPEATKIIIFLGGINYIKGTINFIKSIEYININKFNVKFIIAGKIFCDPKVKSMFSYYNMCNEYLSKPNIKPHVKLLGTVTNIKDLLSVSDIVVSSSVLTHFSRPIIEAWAQKKAVIATDILHSQKLIDNEINGLIVKKDDPKELAEFIGRLLEDNKLSKLLGENGYLKAIKNFSAEINSKKIFDICDNII